MKKQDNTMKKEGEGANVLIIGHKCFRCGHKWVPRENGYVPEICPKCKSPYWKTPKQRFKKTNENSKKGEK